MYVVCINDEPDELSDFSHICLFVYLQYIHELAFEVFEITISNLAHVLFLPISRSFIGSVFVIVWKLSECFYFFFIFIYLFKGITFLSNLKKYYLSIYLSYLCHTSHYYISLWCLYCNSSRSRLPTMPRRAQLENKRLHESIKFKFRARDIYRYVFS